MEDSLRNKVYIDIKWTTLAKVGVFFLLVFVIYKLRAILVFIFLAYIIAVTIAPLAYRLRKKKIPFALSVLIVYVLVFLGIGAIFAIISQPLIEQTTSLTDSVPTIIANIQNLLVNLKETFPILGGLIGNITDQNSQDFANLIVNSVGSLIGSVGGIFGFFFSIFNSVLAVFLILVMAYYMVVDKESNQERLTMRFPEDLRDTVRKTIENINNQLGAWVRGELFLMIIIGTLSYIGLVIFGVPYALPIALLAAFLELIPNIGPVITFVVAILMTIGSGGSLVATIGVGIWFVLIQQFENWFIVPKIMGKVVGLSPLMVILAILAGAELYGIFGALLAVPIVTIGTIIFNSYNDRRQMLKKSSNDKSKK